MASENAEVVRRLLDAFGRDDVDAQLAVLDPDEEQALRAAGLSETATNSEESR